MTKIGFNTGDVPRETIPTIIGRPYLPFMVCGIARKDVYSGRDAIANRAVLELTYPIEHGIVQNWNNLEDIWSHAFHTEMRIDRDDTGNHPVMLTVPPLCCKRDTE